MSINVTVSGNPIRIKRGTMVTTLDPHKQEFEKRRLMRLEQVRQQSKDIAENVRNKLKKEKTKCMSRIEKEGEVKLKNWQARKLLELQNQYHEALDEIGLGHKEATRVAEEEESLLEDLENYDRIARERGRVAAERLQVEKNEESLRKAVPIQRKKITRDGEKNRSVAVTNLGNSKHKKKKKNEIFDSDSENQVPQLFGLGDASDLRSNSSEIEGTQEAARKGTAVLKTSKEQQTSLTNFQVPTSEKAAQTLDFEPPVTPYEFPLDTRISERIKRRARLNPEVDYCDFVEKESRGFQCSCCNCPAKYHPGTTFPRDDRDKTRTRLNPEVGYRDCVEKESKGVQCSCCTCHINQQSHPLDDKVGTAQKSGLSIPEENIREKAGFSQKWDIPFRDDPKRVDSGFKAPQNSEQTLKEGRSRSTTQPETNPQPSDSLFRGDTNLNTKPESTIPQKSVIEKTSNKMEKKVPQRFDQTRKPGPKPKTDIPSKPKVTLRSVKDRPAYVSTDSVPQPVQYYDHPNRYSRLYIPKSSHIDKIDDDNLDISPNVLSEEEIHEKMRQRDMEAHLRGQLALEKEKIQREYRELMKKLPLLQKQERICEIGLDKEKYHMSNNRLEELEKKRQNRLDNAYEELFVRTKPATVTLPRKDDDREEPRSLNLAWDVDFDPKENSNKNRNEQLSHMLSTLKSQKDSLLKEIESTLSKETLTQLAKTSNEDIKSKSTDYTRKTKRKRSRDERPLSPSTTDVMPEEESTRRTKSSKKGTISTGSPSPRKKPKLKTERRVLVLQNTSTQTTPKSDQSVSTSPKVNTPKTEESCTCSKKGTDDFCEIVIKIKEDEKPQVVVNPPSLGQSVRVETEEIKRPSVAEIDGREVKESQKPKKNTSWREQLSQNASSHSSTSTSYYDPPKKTPAGVLKKLEKTTEFEELSRTINSSSEKNDRRLDPRLLTYIKKLLNMSRASIDELTVSTASEVSTPSHSVVETPTNNPLTQLLNVMKYFNIDVADLQKELSYASDGSSKHYNTSETTTLTASSSEGEKVQFKSCTEIDSTFKEKSLEETDKTLLHYADIAANCTKKISNLTAMIEKVRAEKKKIMQSPPTSESDKDLTTTSYLQLPDKKDEVDRSSPKQDEIDRQLLNIDFSYAEKLKQLTKEEIDKEKKRAETGQPTDEELLSRLRNLLQDKKTVTSVPEQADKSKENSTIAMKEDSTTLGVEIEKKLIEQSKGGKTTGQITERTTVTFKPQTEKTDPFPLLLDIPKLPRLEAPSLDKKKKRPPPTKAIRAIPDRVVPHELSTIIEADSQLSTKADSPSKVKSSSESKSEGTHKDSSDDVSEMETMETMLLSIGMEWAIPTLKKTREALAINSSSSGSKESGEVSLREFLSKISSSTLKSGEGSSSLSLSQGMSLIEGDNRKTSTPIGGKKDGPVFLTDSDLSSVREHSVKDSTEKFYDLNEASGSKTG